MEWAARRIEVGGGACRGCWPSRPSRFRPWRRRSAALWRPLAPGIVNRAPELIVFLGSSACPGSGRRGGPGQRPADAAGSPGPRRPLGARFVLPYRATGGTLELLRADPDSPRAVLERALVLTYPFGVDLRKLARALLADPDVLNAGENTEIPLSVTPSDTLFAVRSNPIDYQWGPYVLNLPLAWDRIKGSASIGAVDGGIQSNHPDLQAFSAGSYVGGNYRAHLSWDFAYKDSDADELQNGLGILTTPAAGHGTHVSGILAATANNSRGVAGTCWGCSLLMAKAKTRRTRCGHDLAGGSWRRGDQCQPGGAQPRTTSRQMPSTLRIA